MKRQLEASLPSIVFTNNEKEQYKTQVQSASATDNEILAYLRHSAKLAEIAALAERDLLVLSMCKQLEVTVSTEEWQAAGDTFRLERQLWGTVETLAWLEQQRISVEDWSQGIKVRLLEKKLKECLFGATVDSTYITKCDNYRRVALSQILVADLAIADKIMHTLQQGEASFYTLVLEYSKDQPYQENNNFVKISYLVELLPEITASIINAQEGEVIGPIKTKLGYHLLRLDKWLSSELNQSVREQIIEAMFQFWLKRFK